MSSNDMVESPISKELHIKLFGDEDIDKIKFDVINEDSLNKIEHFKTIFKLINPSFGLYLSYIVKLGDIKDIVKRCIKDIKISNQKNYFIRLRFLKNVGTDEFEKMKNVKTYFKNEEVENINKLFNDINTCMTKLNILLNPEKNMDVLYQLLNDISKLKTLLNFNISSLEMYEIYQELEKEEIRVGIKMIVQKYISNLSIKSKIEIEKIKTDDLLKYSVMINKNRIWFLDSYYTIDELFNRRKELKDEIRILKVCEDENEIDSKINENEQIVDLQLDVDSIEKFEDGIVKIFKKSLKEYVEKKGSDKSGSEELEQSDKSGSENKEKEESDKSGNDKSGNEKYEEYEENENIKDSILNLILSKKLKYKTYVVYPQELI